MIGRVDGGNRHRRVAAHPRQIAVAVTRREQPHQGAVDIVHADQAALIGFVIAGAQPRRVAERLGIALVIDPGLERHGDGFGRIGGVFVVQGYVGHRVAVGDDVTLEIPGPAQMVLEQKVAAAGRLAVDAVIGAHHRTGVAVDDGGAKGRQVGVFQIVGGDEDVGDMARRFGA